MVLLHQLVAMCRNQFLLKNVWHCIAKKENVFTRVSRKYLKPLRVCQRLRKYFMIPYKVSWISSRCAKLRRPDHQILRARLQTPGTFQARCRKRKPTRRVQVQSKWPRFLLQHSRKFDAKRSNCHL